MYFFVFWLIFHVKTEKFNPSDSPSYYGGWRLYRSPDHACTAEETQNNACIELPPVFNDFRVLRNFQLNLTTDSYFGPNINATQDWPMCDHDWRFGAKNPLYQGDSYGPNYCHLRWQCTKPRSVEPDCWGDRGTINGALSLDAQEGMRIQFDFTLYISWFKWTVDCPLCGGFCNFTIPILQSPCSIRMPSCPFTPDIPGLFDIPFKDPMKTPLPHISKLIRGPIRIIADGKKSFEMWIQLDSDDRAWPPAPGYWPPNPKDQESIIRSMSDDNEKVRKRLDPSSLGKGTIQEALTALRALFESLASLPGIDCDIKI